MAAFFVCAEAKVKPPSRQERQEALISGQRTGVNQAYALVRTSEGGSIGPDDL